LHLIEGRFGDMAALLRARGVEAADGVALDLGVSSMQLESADRGFSFRLDGPLDMRMEGAGESAADLVNRLSEDDLAWTLAAYGEEPRSRAVARAIVAARARAPIRRTRELAEIVRPVVRGRGRREAIDPATRTFQALRIRVNDELGEIDRGLAAAEEILRPGGRLAVVSFHSLEDRRIKLFLRDRSGQRAAPSRHAPAAREAGRAPTFRLPARRAIRPSAGEIRRNPRSRSARLRIAERTAGPASGTRPTEGASR
jgi:16S rRNA (cytosine1402-N4)-methyltransferase